MVDRGKVNLELGRKVLEAEGKAIAAIASRIGEGFTAAVRMVYSCEGKVVLTGIGKAGIIAQKVSATLASTGTQSIFLHPVEALHGDLGRLGRADVVIALSHSGESEEIIRLLDHIKRRGASLIAISASDDSLLGRYADVTLCYGDVEEASPLGLVPTVSTSCMLGVGDALALTVMEMRNFQAEDFAAFHPGGALGRKLLKVEEAMTFRKGEKLAVASDAVTLREALEEGEKVKRRSGALLLVDEEGRLSGIITDADLRRLLLRDPAKNLLGRCVGEVMTRDPKHVHLGELASEALAIMNEHRFDELPVLDPEHRPVGLIDVQDLVGIRTVNDERY